MTVQLDFSRMTKDYRSAASRLLVFDYDGTLAPFHLKTDIPKADEAMHSLITSLTSDIRNHVMILSGRDRQSLSSMWNDAAIILVAEHGGYYKIPSGRWHQVFAKRADWISRSMPALNALCFQYEGSFIEEKNFSIAWHYRSFADKISNTEKEKILSAIRALPHSAEFIAYEEDCVIELRTSGVDKGKFVSRWIGNRNYDFIMAIGDGNTDEDLFKVLSNEEYTIRVGEGGESSARFQLSSQADVQPLVSRLLGNHTV